jgi:N-acetylneuraminic acid mutarotase
MKTDSILSVVLSVALLSSTLLLYIEPASAAVSENVWEVKAPVPEALVGGRAGVVGGKVYVMAGYLNYQYDPSTDAWTARKPMPTPRVLFGMAVWQDKIYVIGGGKGVNSMNYRGSLLSDVVEVYDPSTDTWQTKQSMPTARVDLQANVVNGQIYMVGGKGPLYLADGISSDNFNLTINLNEVYDIANDSWATAAPVPYAVYSYTSAVCGDKIYIIGGQSLQAPILNLNYAQIYDCANNSWSFSAPMPTTVMYAAAGATTGEAALRRIYVIGGFTDDYDVLGDVQVYDPQNGSWTLGESMPSARNSHTVAVVDDRLYAIGGKPYGEPHPVLSGDKDTFTHNEVYTPFGYGTPDPAYVFEHTPPNVTFESSLNGTAITNSTMPLVFCVDKVVDWAGYSFDGQGNVTVSGNCTLTGLSSGSHSIRVFANDTYGNMGVSEPLTFTVAFEQSFPLAFVVIGVLAVAVVGVVAGVVVFFKKRR